MISNVVGLFIFWGFLPKEILPASFIEFDRVCNPYRINARLTSASRAKIALISYLGKAVMDDVY